MPSDKAYTDKIHVQGGGIIREVVFGMNDGIVSIFALLAGIAGAGVPAQQILLTLLAATIAGALSMAAGQYLSAKSARKYVESEIHKERLEIKLIPDVERDEIRRIYHNKGFSGDMLEQIVTQITSDPDLWVKEMVVDELGVAEIEQEGELKGVGIIFIAFMAGSMFPTLPYMVLQFLGGTTLFWVATIVTFFGLFLVGALKKFVTGQNWLKSGIEMLVAGTLAFIASYGIGLLVGVSV
jgi:VIT1/CCC1 family predicted Fe2+/Mn2+ transporter